MGQAIRTVRRLLDDFVGAQQQRRRSYPMRHRKWVGGVSKCRGSAANPRSPPPRLNHHQRTVCARKIHRADVSDSVVVHKTAISRRNPQESCLELRACKLEQLECRMLSYREISLSLISAATSRGLNSTAIRPRFEIEFVRA